MESTEDTNQSLPEGQPYSFYCSENRDAFQDGDTEDLTFNSANLPSAMGYIVSIRRTENVLNSLLWHLTNRKINPEEALLILERIFDHPDKIMYRDAAFLFISALECLYSIYWECNFSDNCILTFVRLCYFVEGSVWFLKPQRDMCEYWRTSVQVFQQIAKMQKVISEILLKVQENTTCHKKYYYMLLNLFKSHPTDFPPWLERIVTFIATRDYKANNNIYVDRLINFFVLFCTSSDTVAYTRSLGSQLVYDHVLKLLLELHNLENDSARYRSCQLIGQILNRIEAEEMDGDLVDEIIEAMLQRLVDSLSGVRLQAIYAVFRFQDPSNTDCAITKELLKRILDVSPKIRKATVDKLAVQKSSVKAILDRCRDTNAEVRMAAYLRVSKLCKSIKIVQRQRVIKNGLHDESQRIQAFVKNQLIKAWLACYNDNYLVFLRALMFDSNEEDLKTSAATCLTVTNCLFRIQPWEEIMGVLTLNDQLTIPLDVLSWEAAIYLRLLVEFCRKSDELDTAVEALLPDLVVFGSYIRRFCDMAGNFDQFEVILGEFFIITSTYDLGDSATRETLNGLVKYILRKFDLREEIVETIIRNLEKSMTKVEIRENAILEIIADIKYPTEDDELHSITTKISELKVRARQVKHNQDVAVKEMNYDLAGDCKSELDQIIITIEELQIDFTNSQPLVPITDTITLCRWLKILRGYLVSPTVVYLTPGLKIICDEVVDLLRNTDSNQVRTKALECYALCCIVDEETARAGMYVFYPTMVVTNDVGGDMDTLLMSLKATVDLLSVYGSCIIPSSENNEDVPSIFSFKDVIQSLVNLMDHEDVTVQEWSGVGLCKLIENGRIFSPTVLSRMVLKWCNPSTQDSEGQRLRQAIGMSLEKVPQLANSGEQLESAFFITVETLLNAPKTSPLSEVNVFDIIQFLLQLFSMCDESLYMHKSLALKLCLKLKENPEENTILMYSKTLLLLELLPYDKFHYDKLQALCDEIRALIINPAVLRNVEKFYVQLMDAANENSNA